MFKLNTVVLLLPALAVASLIPSDAQPLMRALPLQAREDISALLRDAGAARGLGLEVRQGTCAVGDLPCSDGQGCCPIGQYCGTWGGKLGCCPNGKSCVANNNPCDFKGDVLCAGETFCCPAGDTCFRDDAGAPKCSASAGGGGGVPTAVTSTTRTTTPVGSTTRTTTPLSTPTRTTTANTSTGTSTGTGSGGAGSGSGSGSGTSGSSGAGNGGSDSGAGGLNTTTGNGATSERGFVAAVTLVALAMSFFAL